MTSSATCSGLSPPFRKPCISKNRSWRIKLGTAFFFGGLGIVLGLFFMYRTSASVAFPSLESITETGKPVFNEIKFIGGWDQDVWLMRQNHKGYGLEKELWDRLAIIVDKTKNPKVASFYQLKPGNLDFESLQEAQPLNARCLACHSNGPRAIRMGLQSNFVKPSLVERSLVTFWNLRIKSYGIVQSTEGIHFKDGVTFKSPIKIFSRPLELKSCTLCHAQNGIRNQLTNEQVGTAHFLVKNRLMPPFPFSASKEDRVLLETLTE